MNDLTHIDLFSGIGGFALAAGWAGFRTIAFCEIEPFCQEVLKSRFGAIADTKVQHRRDISKDFRDGKVRRCRNEFYSVNSNRPTLIPDIFSFDGTRFRGATLLTGGFPCQPFSHAGKRRGKEDDRHLWPEMLRVIREARPAWVLAENVAGLISMELYQVLTDLESAGYEVDPYVVPACAVNAPHRRDRVWIIAYAGCIRQKKPKKQTTGSKQSDINEEYQERYYSWPYFGQWDIPWIEVATCLCRVSNGLPAWVHSRRVARL